MIPCSYWASTCLAALPSCMTLYEISVRQTRDLPVVSLFPHPASFRFHLTMDTLAFGYILPTTGWIRDFNPLETCVAGHTRKMVSDLRTKHHFVYSLSRPSGRLKIYFFGLVFVFISSGSSSAHGNKLSSSSDFGNGPSWRSPSNTYVK